MASQAQLDADIALATARVDSLRLQLDAAAGSINPDPAVIANLERSLAIEQSNLASLESQLANLTVASNDPNTNVGNETEQLPRNQQTIGANTDTNTNTGNEDRAETQRQAELQSIERQEAEAQQIAEQQFIDNEPASAGGSGSYIENANPTFIDPKDDPFEKARLASEEEYNNTPPRTEQDVINAYGGMQGLQGSVDAARGKQITQDAENAKTKGDWRVRLSLAPGAGYLYKAENPGILGYLQKTDGVIFPYTPSIQVTYAAHYDASDLVHSNYKIYQYKNSSVDQVVITCDFTAQDTEEANYLLAVIHFFRSVTKMFYGKDQQPGPGVPPPLCYLSGLGDFQFDKHPLVISSFNYNLPNDVDYIRAGSPTLEPGVDASMYQYQEQPGLIDNGVSCRRLDANGLVAGAGRAAPKFSKATNTQPTYVPTKIQLTITAYPIVTRNDISKNFSLREYATGTLLQGSKRDGGGIW